MRQSLAGLHGRQMTRVQRENLQMHHGTILGNCGEPQHLAAGSALIV